MDEEMADVDVAQLMGFASFGRKRKHSDPAASAPIPSRPATGANDTEVGSAHARASLPAKPHPSLPAKPAASLSAAAPPFAAGEEGRDWWTGYYDPMSNENPWAYSEKMNGLEPVGPWLPRGHHHRRRNEGGEAGDGGEARETGDAPEVGDVTGTEEEEKVGTGGD
ncbi:uncharacterized protein DNG_06058 [Cephalotrichum gorgonifer]|uniref:Uncharacterized protein n=1 Tax=Cephalotrichum gorgonifer TaxID=2041049 RepID=A0AAE8SW43_9PEZI|nr:uncharacterized protein DNG_06058 [Cephalotrichum gorgonifer]